MSGPARCLIAVSFPASALFRPQKSTPNSFRLKILPVTPMGRRFCAQRPGYLHKNEEFAENMGGGGIHSTRYGPGACLTEQTGSIPDTVQKSKRHVEERHAMESEQCDGREGAICAGV